MQAPESIWCRLWGLTLSAQYFCKNHCGEDDEPLEAPRQQPYSINLCEKNGLHIATRALTWVTKGYLGFNTARKSGALVCPASLYTMSLLPSTQFSERLH